MTSLVTIKNRIWPRVWKICDHSRLLSSSRWRPRNESGLGSGEAFSNAQSSILMPIGDSLEEALESALMGIYIFQIPKRNMQLCPRYRATPDCPREDRPGYYLRLGFRQIPPATRKMQNFTVFQNSSDYSSRRERLEMSHVSSRRLGWPTAILDHLSAILCG